MTRFAGTIPRAQKRTAGRTAVADTPMSIRGQLPLDPDVKDRIRNALGRALSHLGTRVERITVRFHDVNGPRGGRDVLCRVKVVISGQPSLVVEERAHDPAEAVLRAAPRLARSLNRAADKRGTKAPAPTNRRLSSPDENARPAESTDAGSFIGRRVGRGPKNLEAALERPEKRRRDTYVDTAAPGQSETERRAGGPSTARRNSKRRDAGMTATLEDSRTTPSRKSTRRSSNRIKSGTPLTTRQKGRTSSPQARNVRGR